MGPEPFRRVPGAVPSVVTADGYPVPEDPHVTSHAAPRHVGLAALGARVPLALALLFALFGVGCILQGAGVGDRGSVWRGTARAGAVLPVASGLMLPVGVALLLLAPALWGRRRRAWMVCLVLFGLLGVLAAATLSRMGIAATWGTLALLLAARDHFVVEGDDEATRTPRVAFVMLAGAVVSAIATAWLIVGQAPDDWGWSGGYEEVASLLVAATAPIDPAGLSAVLAALTGLLSLGSIAIITRAAFAAPSVPPNATGEPGIRQALTVVRAHGDDSLSFFTLRPDVAHVWSPDGRAFAAVRREAGVLLISGDPVGPDDAIPGLLDLLWETARREGNRLAAVGADDEMTAVYRQLGMRRVYIGDEAVVHTSGFTLQGRPIRKVRQSVNRLERDGFAFSMQRLGDLGDDVVGRLRDISVRWLDGGEERGFSMALDDLGGGHQRDTWVAIAHDADGVPRGFLQFVPAGRTGASLSFMRRDPDTPNGLSEFLVARSLEWFREAGVEHVSLNFATFGRLLREPRGRGGRLLKRAIKHVDRFFQVDSLLSFNEKFFPEWAPRYLVVQGWAHLPRAALACLWAEGQLPRPPGRRGG